ncbi:hypothetical protein D918_00088 [Trichuris suis]|nr:hypothetical protein D918_00088 [Trichuris suis]
MGNCCGRKSKTITTPVSSTQAKMANQDGTQFRKIGEIPDDELHFVFSQFDVNGDGFISESELKQVMMRLGQEPNPDELRAMFKAADLNRDGKISFEEFCEIAKANPLSMSLKTVFCDMDRDGDGYITREEMFESLKRMGHSISNDELNAIYRTVDLDKNSKIDFDGTSTSTYAVQL